MSLKKQMVEEVKVLEHKNVEQVPFDSHIYVTTGPIFTKLARMVRLMILMHLTLNLFHRFWMLEELMVFEAGYIFFSEQVHFDGHI